jgi:hypothetical protein
LSRVNSELLFGYATEDLIEQASIDNLYRCNLHASGNSSPKLSITPWIVVTPTLGLPVVCACVQDNEKGEFLLVRGY